MGCDLVSLFNVRQRKEDAGKLWISTKAFVRGCIVVHNQPKLNED